MKGPKGAQRGRRQNQAARPRAGKASGRGSGLQRRDRAGAPGDQPATELVIDALAAGGDGIGRDRDGRVVFVPAAAPGDRARVRVRESHKDYARAELIAVTRAGPGRVEARCRHFVDRTCGGCQWLHVSPEVQAAAKQDIVARSLRKQVEAGMQLRPLLTPVGPYHWRRRARLRWYRGRKSERAVLGFLGPRSHRVGDISDCVQLTEPVAQAVAVLRRALAPGLGRQGRIELLAGHRDQVHVAIYGSASAEAAAGLVGQGPIVGVTLDPAQEPGPEARARHRLSSASGPAAKPRPSEQPPNRGRNQRQRWGAPHIELEPGLLGRADWFAQPAHAGNQALLALVDEAAAPRAGLRVLELYAGSGNFTRRLAPGTSQYLAVDWSQPPWPLPGAESIAFTPGEVAQVVQALAADEARFDVAVLDPPRTGARAVIAPLCTLGPTRIAYVSCDPATLARDLIQLSAAGYRAAWAQPIDLMPQTAHIEVVVRLERAQAAA